MKKTYIQPAVTIVNVQIQNLMLEASAMSAGSDWTSGEAASRGGSWDDED